MVGMSARRVAVVGLGIGRSHLAEGYSKLHDAFEVAAICDLDESRLSRVGDEFGIARRTKSFDAIIADPTIDIVDICTPPSIHETQIIAALAAGKHVVCEKPLVGSLAAMDRVAAAESSSRARVMPIFQYRWGVGYRKAEALVRAGLAGKAYIATCETHWKRTSDYYAVPWRGKFSTELGGVLLSQAIHLHDMMCGLMGPVARVYSEATTRVNAIEVEDCVAASLAMRDGSVVTLSCTLGAKQEISRLKACFEHVTLESGGPPYSPGDEPWRFVATDPARQAEIDAFLANIPPVDPRFLGQLRALHAALASGAEPPVTLVDARASLELVTALYSSAARHAPETLPLPPTHPRYADWRADKGISS